MRKLGASWREQLRTAYGTPEGDTLRESLLQRGVLNPEAERQKVLDAAKTLTDRLGAKVIKSKYIPSIFARTVTPPFLPPIIFGPADTEAGAPLVHLHEAFEAETSKKKVQAITKQLLSPPPDAGNVLQRVRKAYQDLKAMKTQHWAGHADPSVLLREGQIVPFLPEYDTGFLNELRGISGEAGAAEKAGIRLGAIPKVLKTQVRRLGRQDAAQFGLKHRILEQFGVSESAGFLKNLKTLWQLARGVPK